MLTVYQVLVNRPKRSGMRMGHWARSRERSYSLFPSPQSRIFELLLVSMRNYDLVLVGRLQVSYYKVSYLTSQL